MIVYMQEMLKRKATLTVCIQLQTTEIQYTNVPTIPSVHGFGEIINYI